MTWLQKYHSVKENVVFSTTLAENKNFTCNFLRTICIVKEFLLNQHIANTVFFFCPLRHFICITPLEKESKCFPYCVLSCFFMVHMPAQVFSTMKPNWWGGSRLFCHFSRSLSLTSNLRLITPHLFILPVCSQQFSQPCDHRWFKIHPCNHASSSQLETWWWLWSTAL